MQAQSELQREELVTAEIDLDQATRAMFRFDLEDCAELLFGDTVQPEEYAAALPVHATFITGKTLATKAMFSAMVRRHFRGQRLKAKAT